MTGSAPAGPRFVERGGEVVYRQPFTAHGVRLYAFLLEADVTRLDQWFERSFAEPSDESVQLYPAGSQVVLAFATIERMGPSEPPDSLLGATKEVEAAIWAPAYDASDNQLVWTMPYVFVDQMAPIAGGREIYGYPKQLGQITLHEPRDAPVSMSVRTWAVKEFSPDALAREELVMSVSRPPDGPVPEPWLNVADAHRHLLRQAGAVEPIRSGRRASNLDDTALAALLVEDILRCQVPMVFLKQFRSCEVPELACYQAIVGVDLGLARLRGAGRLPDDYTVKLEVLDSEPLVADLGLHRHQHSPLAFWVDFDFTVPRGEVLWQAGAASP